MRECPLRRLNGTGDRNSSLEDYYLLNLRRESNALILAKPGMRIRIFERAC